MRKIFSHLMLFILLAFTHHTLAAADTINCNHSRGKSKHNYFPTARFVLSPLFLENESALSLLGEVGPRNYRVNGTFGFLSSESAQRFKVSAEYLSQKLQYKFSSGKERRWMHQLGLGAMYQYWFDCPGFVKALQLHGVYSNSYNHKLKRLECPGQNLSIKRRIAGAWFYALEGGLVFSPWNCGTLISSLSYDQVRYKRQYESKKRLSGIGAAFELIQRLGNNYLFIGRLEFKKPYNYLEALLTWNRKCGCGDLTLGVFSSHTWGKSRLPSTTTLGIEVGFNFGVNGFGRGECCPSDPCASLCNSQELAGWVATPAVYMPIVLAIAEEKIKDTCVAPTGTSLPNVTVPSDQAFTIQTAFAFQANGNTLSFSAAGLPPGATIDPTTGVISGFNPGLVNQDTFIVTVTASSICGTASQTFTLILEGGVN